MASPFDRAREAYEKEERGRKPKRVREIERDAALLFPFRKIGGFISETEDWETWVAPMADGSLIIVQYYYSASFNKKRTEEIIISEEEVIELLHSMSLWRIKRR